MATVPSTDRPSVARRPAPVPAEPVATGPWLTRERALVLVLIAVTAIVVYLCYRLVLPFLPALGWALAFAVVARPAHAWIARHVPSANLAALLAVVLVAVVLVVPGLFLLNQLGQEAAANAPRLRTEAASGRWREAIEANEHLAPVLAWVEKNIDVEKQVRQVMDGELANLRGILTGSVSAVALLLITFYLLFYFFRDRRLLLQGVRALLPLSRAEADEVAQRVADTIQGTVNGTLMVAAIQGALGGFMFWYLGLPGPVMWGAIMALLSVIPYAGAFIVWIPAALWLALDGQGGPAIVLFAWGAIVVGFIDNLLYPILVGKQLHVHPLLAFLGIVGGLSTFGASGVVLGPITVAIALVLFHIWHLRMADGGAAEEPVRDKDALAEVDGGG